MCGIKSGRFSLGLSIVSMQWNTVFWKLRFLCVSISKIHLKKSLWISQKILHFASVLRTVPRVLHKTGRGDDLGFVLFDFSEEQGCLQRLPGVGDSRLLPLACGCFSEVSLLLCSRCESGVPRRMAASQAAAFPYVVHLLRTSH